MPVDRKMAAAFFNVLADIRLVRAVSASTQPVEQVYPVVVAVMREVGVDLSGVKPQKLTPELARDAEMLITMGCGDECPYVAGLRRQDWPLPDPRGRSIEDVRVVRDEVRWCVSELVRPKG
jgi:arsenate reductase